MRRRALPQRQQLSAALAAQMARREEGESDFASASAGANAQQTPSRSELRRKPKARTA